MRDHLERKHRENCSFLDTEPAVANKALSDMRSLQKKLDSYVLDTIFMGGQPFSHFDRNSSKGTLYGMMLDMGESYGLHNYEPPSRSTVTRALGPYYGKLLQETKSWLQAATYLNFTVDEATDPTSRRILNLSAVVPGVSSFFLENIDLGPKK